MDSKYRHKLTQTAAKNFQQIYDYIAENLNNTEAAEKITQKFLSAIRNACLFPTMNPKYKNYRKIVVDNYLMFYKVDEKEKLLIIHCALYGAMDYEKLL